jgi:hypothetical protein
MSDDKSQYEEALEYYEQVRRELSRREEVLNRVRAEKAKLAAEIEGGKVSRMVLQGNVLGVLSASSHREKLRKMYSEKEKESIQAQAEVERAQARLAEVEQEIEGYKA